MNPRSSPSRPLAYLAGLSAVLLLAWSGDGAQALSLKPANVTTIQTRDGKVVAPEADKVSSPDLPITQSATQSFGPVVPSGGNAGASTGTIQFSDNVTIVADPGDAPGAALCLSYRFSASVAATVVSPTASAAGGIGSATGFNLSTAAQPVTVTVANPAVLTVTPTVGPVRTIFSVAPQTFGVTSGAGLANASNFGEFSVQAGDVIDFGMQTGVGARAEDPSGAVNITASQAFFSLREGCGASIPALSNSALAGLGMLVLLLAALGGGLNVARRAKR